MSAQGQTEATTVHEQSRSAPYGLWDSPITAKEVALNGSIIGSSVQDILVDPVTTKIYYLDEKMSEGINVLLSVETGHEVIGSPWNVASAVHEYGGAPCIINDGTIFFSNLTDNRIYRKKGVDDPTPITPVNARFRYADFALHPLSNRFMVCVLEDHTIDVPESVVNKLVLIDTDTHTVTDLVKGADFYSSPRFSPDGKYLSWKQWNHPNMPWEGSQLLVAPSFVSADGPSGLPLIILGNPVIVSGKPSGFGATEPAWATPRKLLFISDEDQYLNPWQFDISDTDFTKSKASPISPTLIPEDFGEPYWFLSWSSYARLDDTHFVYSSFRNGRSQLYVVDVQSRSFNAIPTPFAYVQYLRHAPPNKVVFFAKRSAANDTLVEMSLDPTNLTPTYKTLKTIGKIDLSKYSSSLISHPQALELQSEITGQSLHINFYPPTNPAYDGGIPGELPPVILYIHGGPTAFLNQGLDLSKQYFTTRGFAFIDLNQGGSSAYGREYRERLNGQWGPLDAKDAVEAVRQLGERGMVDAKRAAVRGGSAGGFATWVTVTEYPYSFAAATVLCGISDVRTLRATGHKFESHYTDTLIGARLEDDPERWKDRSPITKAREVRVPLVVIHGKVDPVVPVAQAETMVEIIRQNGGDVDFVVADGEGHMFRKAETSQIWLEKELALYQRVLTTT